MGPGYNMTLRDVVQLCTAHAKRLDEANFISEGQRADGSRPSNVEQSLV